MSPNHQGLELEAPFSVFIAFRMFVVLWLLSEGRSYYWMLFRLLIQFVKLSEAEIGSIRKLGEVDVGERRLSMLWDGKKS